MVEVLVGGSVVGVGGVLGHPLGIGRRRMGASGGREVSGMKTFLNVVTKIGKRRAMILMWWKGGRRCLNRREEGKGRG
jgi:hypothetical protein